MSYDHLLWPTGTAYFFSAHLRDRSSSLLVEQAQTLRLAFRVAQQARPFRINAIVVLPDHLHGVWTLPEGDEEGHRRWAQVQAIFDRQLPMVDPRLQLRRDRSRRPYGTTASASTGSLTPRTCNGTWPMCTTTRSSTGT